MSLPLKGWNSFLDFIGSVIFLHGAVKPELPASEEASRGYEGTLDSLSLAEILPLIPSQYHGSPSFLVFPFLNHFPT